MYSIDSNLTILPLTITSELLTILSVQWNTTLTESRLVARLSSSTFLTHGVTAEGAGGLVSARDFVYGAKVVRRHGRWGSCWHGALVTCTGSRVMCHVPGW